MAAISSSTVTERHILDAVGDNRYTREVLRRLVALQIVERSGLGGATDPYLYRILRTPEEAARLGAVDPAQQKRLQNNEAKVLTFLAPQLDFVLEKTIRSALGDNTGIGSALRRLVSDKRVLRSGRGGSAQPFTYRINLDHQEARTCVQRESFTNSVMGTESGPAPELVAMPVVSPAGFADTLQASGDSIVSQLWFDCASPTSSDRACNVSNWDLLAGAMASPGSASDSEASEAETIIDLDHSPQAQDARGPSASATRSPPVAHELARHDSRRRLHDLRPPPIDPASEQVIFSDFESPDSVFHDSLFAF